MRRRTFLRATGGTIALGTTGCVAAPSAEEWAERAAPPGDPPSGTWPQVARDARNSRHAPGPGPRDGAEIAWWGLGDRPVYPPVVDGDLYLTEAWTDGTALALSPEAGRLRWANPGPPPIRWAPALANDRLLVVSRAPGNVVRLHALEATSGEEAWVREDGVTASSGEHPPVGPTVLGETLYLASNRGVLALAADTGDLEWDATLGPHVVEADGGPTWRTDWATPAVTPDRAYTFDRNESFRSTRVVYAVHRATGRLDWAAELDVGDGWSLAGHVVAGEGRVFVVAIEPSTSADDGELVELGAGRLFALDADSGSVEWERERPRGSIGVPAVGDGTLYVATWSPATDEGRLHALDVADGSARWSRPTGEVARPPTVAGNTVYLAHGRRLTALATRDGSRRWTLGLGAPVASPVVVGDVAYVSTNPGHDHESRLVAVRAA